MSLRNGRHPIDSTSELEEHVGVASGPNGGRSFRKWWQSGGKGSDASMWRMTFVMMVSAIATLIVGFVTMVIGFVSLLVAAVALMVATHTKPATMESKLKILQHHIIHAAWAHLDSLLSIARLVPYLAVAGLYFEYRWGVRLLTLIGLGTHIVSMPWLTMIERRRASLNQTKRKSAVSVSPAVSDFALAA